MKKLILAIVAMLMLFNLSAQSLWEADIVDASITQTTSVNSVYSQKYIVELEIKQVHYSLKFKDHLKDSLNKFSIEIPVDKDFYDFVHVGETLDSSFRLGSMLLHGSYGSWKVRIANKYIK